MQVQSARFGVMEIDEKTILYFKEGLPGFGMLNRFVIVTCEETSPIAWLQAVDEKNVALPIIDPFIIYPAYQVDFEDKECAELGGTDEKDLLVFAIMVIPGSLEKATINLCAPIVVNVTTHKAKQLIIDYKLGNAIRYPAYEGLSQYYKEMQASASFDT